MKNFALGVVLFATSFYVSAESCVTLDYQEMKDMSKKDLTTEYCSAVKISGENIQSSLSAIQNGGNHKKYNDEAGKCMDQAKRLSRVLEKKGLKTKNYDVFCKAVEH